ncbi:hypothetical protein [Streptomyces sp. CBMA370]|uniref:hypothetical protein n=1 Tax=Streptomyces sp. CBMA370 TaxID=1930278 RepID=UPI001661A042|nr:hypothetical protein [Streptomyces sp. CBMA370]
MSNQDGENASAERISWAKVWQQAQKLSAVEFVRWAEGGGFTLAGPAVEHTKRMSANVRERFERDECAKAGHCGCWDLPRSGQACCNCHTPKP